MTQPPRGTRRSEPIVDLLYRLRGEVGQVLWAFRLDERAAEEILGEIFLMLAYRWDRIANRERWLLVTLERSCLRYAQRHENRTP